MDSSLLTIAHKIPFKTPHFLCTELPHVLCGLRSPAFFFVAESDYFFFFFEKIFLALFIDRTFRPFLPQLNQSTLQSPQIQATRSPSFSDKFRSHLSIYVSSPPVLLFYAVVRPTYFSPFFGGALLILETFVELLLFFLTLRMYLYHRCPLNSWSRPPLHRPSLRPPASPFLLSPRLFPTDHWCVSPRAGIRKSSFRLLS